VSAQAPTDPVRRIWVGGASADDQLRRQFEAVGVAGPSARECQEEPAAVAPIRSSGPPVGTEGSFADFVFGDCNLNDNVFLSPGPGQSQVVVGNIRGAVDWDTNYAAPFFTQPNCQGDYSILPPGNAIFNPATDLFPWRSFTWIWWGCC
jgi:hypothetical protein